MDTFYPVGYRIPVVKYPLFSFHALFSDVFHVSIMINILHILNSYHSTSQCGTPFAYNNLKEILNDAGVFHGTQKKITHPYPGAASHPRLIGDGPPQEGP